MKKLFWLHIKKSAGISTRFLLQPHYVEVDRVKNPKNFIQSSPEEYNDILNNFRVVLGKYQFKRCLFAKRFLYTEKWDDYFSFAFSREPIDRCVSMFYYLFWNGSGPLRTLTRSLKRSYKTKKLILNTSYAFDVFLENVKEARLSESIYYPLGLHFTTHTAPMWDDITDFNGKILLNQVYRLENLVNGINSAFETCGIDKKIEINDGKKFNKNRSRKDYSPNLRQKAIIKEIFYNDFEIYEKSSL